MEASFVGGKEADEVDKSRNASATNAISMRSSHTLSLLLAHPYCLDSSVAAGCLFAICENTWDIINVIWGR